MQPTKSAGRGTLRTETSHEWPLPTLSAQRVCGTYTHRPASPAHSLCRQPLAPKASLTARRSLSRASGGLGGRPAPRRAVAGLNARVNYS